MLVTEDDHVSVGKLCGDGKPQHMAGVHFSW